MHFNETLHRLGFSPIEATIYITLCENGALTGYEASKLTGISRSNVYAALHSLEEKGRCHICEGETAKYVAISKEELILCIKRETEKNLKEIENHFPKRIEPVEPYVSIRGYDHMLDKIKNCILLCKSHIYILATAHYIELFKDELLSIENSRKVTIISEQKLKLGHNIICYKRNKSPEGFHMIIDTEAVLTGDLLAPNAQCLFSKNPSLVRLMRESFVTELDIIKLNNK